MQQLDAAALEHFQLHEDAGKAFTIALYRQFSAFGALYPGQSGIACCSSAQSTKQPSTTITCQLDFSPKSNPSHGLLRIAGHLSRYSLLCNSLFDDKVSLPHCEAEVSRDATLASLY